MITSFLINSPLEQFEIQSIVNLESPFKTLTLFSVSSFSIYCIFIIFITFYFSTYSFLYINIKKGYVWIGDRFVTVKIKRNTNKVRIIPIRWSLGFESLYDTVKDIVITQIGITGQMYFPFILALFIFILLANLISLIPANLAINAQLIFTIGLSLSIWFGNTILGLIKLNFEFFNLFLPNGTSLILAPILVLIETLSYLARALSLGLRLGSNILAGHLLLIILCTLTLDFMSISIIYFFISFIPFMLILGILCLESAIAAIQAFVFCILTCSYLKDALFVH